jgi:hypothetical protein
VTLVEFLEARLETDRGEAQYVLNLMSAGDAPVMYGSLKSAIINTCERVLADVETKRRIIEMSKDPLTCDDVHPTMDVYHPDGHGPNKVLLTMAADYSDHSDYQEVGRP